MSLPCFSTQSELFSTAGLSASLFAPTDRYRLFAKVVYPHLVAARAKLEQCYCLENGRIALEPVLMLGSSLLQYLDGVPDRLAVELLRYHAGWNFALNRQLGDPVFHPSSLVNFRNRLEEHQQSALGFTTILDALEAAGLVSRQSRQRLDSTQMFGRVAKMSRLDCVRESLRLALQELAEGLPAGARPSFWVGLWEQYVESQVDYRSSAESLARKLTEAGTAAWQLLDWLGQAEQAPVAAGPQVQLLRRVFAEQFEVQVGQPTPATKEKILEPANRLSAPFAAAEQTAGPVTVQPESNPVPVAHDHSVAVPQAKQLCLQPEPSQPAGLPAEAREPSDCAGLVTDPPPGQAPPVARGEKTVEPATSPATPSEAAEEQPGAAITPAPPQAQPLAPASQDSIGAPPLDPPSPKAEAAETAGTWAASGPAHRSGSATDPPLDLGSQTLAAPRYAEIQPKDKKQLPSERVQNPHDPDATYAAKGQGDKKKEHVGYKIQVAETVCEATLERGEPTCNFIVGIVTHLAYESDEAGAVRMEAEQAAMGLAKPPVNYVDAAYISADKLVEAAAEGRELIGPAPAPANNNDGRFTSEAFQVQVEQRRASCPGGHQNTQCSRLEEQATGRVSYRFEWDTATCTACPLRAQCIKAEHKHRTLVVGEHHTALQTRRQEQRTPEFKQRMRQRNGIEGTQSELVRGHGLRHARYRGLAKSKLQNYFTGAACNLKRWLRRVAWKMERAAMAGLDAAAMAN